jgi:integrase
MLSWAREHRLVGSNPIEKLRALPCDGSKEGRSLSPNEVAALLDASTSHYRDIWYAFLVTGLRRDELTGLLFSDIDWQGRELIVRSGTAKNHTTRRVPLDDQLFGIFCCQREKAAERQPGAAGGVKATARIVEKFSQAHVFVTAQGTPLGCNLYREFMRTCDRAKIETTTKNVKGSVLEHIDLHSLRRTFATNLIENGADPRTVQELLGHKRLDMTMRIYAKVRAQTKRSAIGKLSYGTGAQSPEGVVDFNQQSRSAAG